MITKHLVKGEKLSVALVCLAMLLSLAPAADTSPTSGAPVAQAQTGTWITYNTDNSGLAYNNVSAIAIDSAGQLWFGYRDYPSPWASWCGVSKFDGAAWTTYATTKAAIEANYSDILTTIDENSMWTVQPPDKAMDG